MNRDMSMLTRELALIPESTFKQDPKLVAAIDKLCSNQQGNLNLSKEKGVMLPDRQLEFTEVQKLLKESSKAKSEFYLFF